MKRICRLVLVSVLAATSASAAGSEDGAPGGAQEFLEDLLEDMQPMWHELQGFLDAMGPALLGLMDQVKDWSAYEPPEILENGDIIIRRKPGAPSEDAQELPAPTEL